MCLEWSAGEAVWAAAVYFFVSFFCAHEKSESIEAEHGWL